MLMREVCCMNKINSIIIYFWFMIPVYVI